jgi:hypothetical protein
VCSPFIFIVCKKETISRLYYKHGKRDLELTETIVSNNLPESFEAFYHHKHMDNTMKCQFAPLDEFTTRYDYEFEYTRIEWIIQGSCPYCFPECSENRAKNG